MALLLSLMGCDQTGDKSASSMNETGNDAIELHSVQQISALIPARVKNRSGWGADIHRIMAELNIRQTKQNVCSVIAVVDQESNFNANPAVPDLGKKAIRAFETEIPEKFIRQFGATLGPAVSRYFNYVLINEPSVENSFLMQIRQVKTEQQLDMIYRQIFTYVAKKFYADSLTQAAARFMGKDFSEENNPITTIGSMQVAVQYARDHQRDQSSINQLRDFMYTREGGLYYGIHRLMDYPAAYNKQIYRFADYNSGMYSSRNAALQQDLAQLLKTDLVLDGDLLSYDKEGQASISPSQTETALNQLFADYHLEVSADKIRKDLLKEKQPDFEATDTYRHVLTLYQQKTGKKPPYAIMPQVIISGPKLKQDYNTHWYAASVQRRFEACMQRGGRARRG
ncbi:DUF1615 family protein [Neisseriaceae bacterium ESL0693]|nr:DUF1615 family protein [Neisseriaceae bacterium ESL0693]